MPTFIDFGSRLTTSPPVVSTGVTLYGFILLVDDPTKLSTLCQRVFSEPSQGAVTCTPKGNVVYLWFGSIQRLGRDTGPTISEKNVLIQVPVHVKSTDARPDTRSIDDDALFTPFIWVDNPRSMAGGREVFGYPKSIGCIQIAVDNAVLTSASLDAQAGNNSDPTWQKRRLISVQRPASAGVKPVSSDDMTGEPNGAHAELFKKYVQGTQVTEVFLKQFRVICPNGSDAASLQQITTAKYRASSNGRARYASKFEVKFCGYHSDPIIDDLGLGAIYNAQHVWKVTRDFVLDGGAILWEA